MLNRRYILFILFACVLCVCPRVYAQMDTIRYVRTTGAYNNDGKSWEKAKNNVQDAINDLRDYLAANNLTSGSVYIASGTYVPTESTETIGGSMLNSSFKIYAGIHVYGGFNQLAPEARPGDRIMANDKKCSENWADPSGIGTTDGTQISAQWDLKYKTILSGNHASTPPTFEYDPIRGRYNTTFPASSFHVVWFATNGVFETTNDSIAGHFKPLAHPALLDGCVISSGNASSRNTNFRDHTGYGGGVYMVDNAEIRNCIIERCNANLGGGGVYMDGGGIMEFCFVKTCQSAGVGVVEGYGGGVLVEYDGHVGHSHITSCAARCGGGLAIAHTRGTYPWQLRVQEHIMDSDTEQVNQYSPFATACVINNNTASAEAGAIYLVDGGTINHCTVTANNCIGPDVTYYGRRHGRTGGIYIRNSGLIFNSVFWGNKCASNNDIQFASVRQQSAPTDSVFVYHSAFMNHDISDWTGVQKEMVFSLDKQNLPKEGSSLNFPCFFKPTVNPMKWDEYNSEEGLYGAGVLATLRPVDIPGPRIWHLTSHSDLDQKGVQYSSAMVDPPVWLVHAHTEYGVVTNPYEPVSTLGALVRRPDKMRHALLPQQGLEGRNDNATQIPTLFVDLNHEGHFDSEGSFITHAYFGDNWEEPLRSIGDALMYCRTYLVEEPNKPIGQRAHYHLPKAWDEDGNPTEYDDYNYVQLLVKEGEQSTAGPNNYLGKDMRTASIRTLSHMRLYGGYPKDLTGTNTTGRDPLNNPTIITANITEEKGESAYKNNSAHVLTYVNAEYTIVDGFQLLNGNAHHLNGTQAVSAGGGVLVSNEITDITMRIDMVGNELRNCLLANNSAPKGAAIFVSGDNKKRQGFIMQLCYAELKVVNCIIRNNTADYSSENNNGVVTANCRAFIDIDHCNIVNNVGYPLQSDNTVWRTGAKEDQWHGYIRMDNSLLFCNGTSVLNDCSTLASNNVLSVDATGQDYVFGTYNMFDADITLHTADASQPHGFFKSGFVIPTVGGVLPTGMPDEANHPLKLAMPEEKYNQCKFTRTDPNVATYPVFINPSRNIGHSVMGDRPLYGGKVSFIPLNNNPCVNAASVSAYGANNIPRPDAEDFDMTDNNRRNFGGEPDIGALEDTDLPISGSVIYVTPEGAGKRDGSSWANAIAGNTVYRLYGAPAAEGDSIDAASNARVINKSSGEPVLTTDDRYQGGFGRAYFTEKKTGGASTTTVRHAWTTETNVYDDGSHEPVIVKNNEYSETTNTVVNSAGTADPGSVGWNMDTRYPYGEISGQSRAFWRAWGNRCPVNEKNQWNTTNYKGSTSDKTQARNALTHPDSIAKAMTTGLNMAAVITNERVENYVSGLQYAVEEASRINKTNHNTDVQVWVGAGKYTDYKGYIMRDSVSVYGGFPAGKYAAPGMNERRALMSDSAIVAIPKSAENKNLDAIDYETILQVSDTNPRLNETTFNPKAKFFDDNDFKVNEVTDTRRHEYKNITLVNHLVYREIIDTKDTTDYIQYPDMTHDPTSNINVTHTDYRTTTEGVDSIRVTFGSVPVPGTKDCWHMTYPNKPNYVANIETGNSGDAGNAGYTKNKQRTIVDPNTQKDIDKYKGNWVFIGNGSLTGLKLWQDLSDVLAGDYQLSIDIAGGYRNQFRDTANTKMYLRIYNASGAKCAEVNIKTRGSVKNDNNQTSVNNRSMAYRHVLTFNQPTKGRVRIAVEVEDGVRNKGASYPKTPSGGDPDPIPESYVSNYGGSNPNRREFWFSNLHLSQLIDRGSGYVVDHTDKDSTVNDDVPHLPEAITDTTIYTVDNSLANNSKSRTTIRKRVLQMPDVCNPLFAYPLGNPTGVGSQVENSIEHVERVNKPTRKSRGSGQIAVNDPNYKEYNEVYWDGFTIRHGFVADQSSVHAGGAGVAMYEGGHLLNCIITDNIAAAAKQKGGGFFCDGSNSTVEGCFILNNTTAPSPTPTIEGDRTQMFAGGMFLYNGTCFNSLIANNYAHGYGGGLGLCVGNFYNNTVAYNTGGLAIPSSKTSPKDIGKTVGGVRLASGSTPAILMANTILYGNSGLAVDITADGSVKPAPFMHCYIHSKDSITRPEFLHAINSHVDGVTDKNYGLNNTFLNKVDPSAENTPFGADVENDTSYTAGAKTSNNFALRLTDGFTCVNMGTEDFKGAMETCLAYPNTEISNANKIAFRAMVDSVELPSNDVVFAKRVQDCQVDIGAYEFNGAYGIKPDTITHPGKAIFYAAYVSPGGDASASSPFNAACAQKFQFILDAAGRYKYNLMTKPEYNRGYTVVDEKEVPSAFVAEQPNKHWTVEVWLQGDSTNCTTSGEYDQWYTPTRSTKHSSENYHDDNPLDYSFIVPHGIYVKGGYAPGFYHYENAAGVSIMSSDGVLLTNQDTTGMVLHIVDDRDPLTFRSVLSGKITSNTGAEGNCYHVVTFTDDLFTELEEVKDDGGQLAFMSALQDAETHRAVLDGLFIEDGVANASDNEDRIGGGAVVAGFAHIRNCVVQNNEAEDYGGGLYLKPCALVSGTIIKKNTADVGGGVYIEAPQTHNVDSLAHVFTTTICHNSAHATAGGMWFDNTFARVNSTALWQNTANDYANVSGNFSRTSANTDYPFNFCAVESRRIEGQGNLELSPRESEGVRWDTRDPFNDIMYYPIVMSSTLARAGVTYAEWKTTMDKYTTLDSIDIAGVARMQWTGDSVPRGFAWGSDTLVTKNNDFIEIGARALNNTFEIVVNDKYVMRRLYVIHTDLLHSDEAYALQQNPARDDVSEMYRQMGSCIFNPFHRLGDALDYIIKVRRAHPDSLRNARFEIFLEKGTYYPYTNAHGEQGQVRANTFLIPEAVTIVGGINSSTGLNYGQEGFEDKYTNTIINTYHGENVRIGDTGYPVIYASDKTIRQCDDEHRKMRDYNLNSVIEPWEFDRQSVLSGATVSQDSATNSYHVITIHADSTKVGPQPLKFKADSSAIVDWRKGGKILQEPIKADADSLFYLECEESKYARSIILDGVQIMGGYANNISRADIVAHPYQAKTYFRGGGIFVDGNWTQSFDTVADVPNVTEPALYDIPLVIRNCQFTGNMAGNGGAVYSNGSLHIYNSHFVQNYSQGPMTKLDQDYIPWTAGGCVASNAYCGIVNCLFDNNEARRGLYPITVSGEEYIPDADARQGFGGVLSISEQSRLRAANCHFVRNKAVAYPAIYNFRPNSFYHNRDSIQLAFNSIFWGNEVFEVEDLSKLPHIEAPTSATINTFNTKYKPSRKGVFHYDGDEWDAYEKLYHEYDSIFSYYVATNHGYDGVLSDKLEKLREQGDKVEGMYFCSYRQGYGPSGMKPTHDGYLLNEGERNNFEDPRKMPLPIHEVNKDFVEDFEKLFTTVHGNNNVLINRVNTATDGPNFKQPSPIAGIDGYMQNADWLLARMNHTTDQGWGHLKQNVERATYYTTTYTGNAHFNTADEALAAAQAIEPLVATINDVVMHHGMPSATFVGVEDQDTTALYNFLSKRAREHSLTWPRVPIGDDYYMTFTRAGAEGEEMSGEMRRISSNPRMGIEDVYVDIGVYEYQYIQLDLKGNEVDTMWVATKAKSDKQDGLTWETPTTDLQMAIDVLMASHDNHDKYVCFLGDEESHFAPSNIIDNRRTFVISSNTLSPLLPDSAMADTDYGVNSLTFLGGYSFDVKDKPRDPVAYPTVIEMPHAGNVTQLNQLFVIEDVTRQMLQANWQGELITRDTVVIPITFDGITFINPYSAKNTDQGTYELGGVMSDRGGAAIYYRWQRQYEEDNNSGIFNPNFNLALYPDSTMIDGHKVTFPKLTISNCVFMDNGDRTDNINRRSAAVRIEHGGGSSLIVNTVFHSNAGEPIHADRHDIILGHENNLAAVPNDVIIVNSTSALNDGHITLLSDNSEVHNSLIWLDDLANDTAVQLTLHNDQWDKTTNKNKVGIANRVTYNAIWNCFLDGDDDYHNEPLSTDNMNIFEGPYFVDPNVNATTSDERRARSFRLNPAVRTMNAADTTVYRNRVFYRQYPDITEELYWRRPNGFKADTITRLAMDYDLAYKPRLSGLGMERGAYECLAVLQRILYVNPTVPEAAAGDGSSWQSPFGRGQIQNAIDVAAVYNYLNSKLDAESRRAYVFVKASAGATEEEDIIARDGVTVLGSIPGNFNDTAFITKDVLTEEEYYANEECQRFVNYVRAVTNGVASVDATPTYINSVSTIAGIYPLGFSIENFVISNPNKVLTASPISIDNDSVTVRNCIIANNKVVGAPVIDLKKGLIYNSLIYRDSANAIINLGANGLLLNNTIVNNYGDGVTNIANIDNTRVVNNLSCTASTANCFAPYLAQKNAYTLPDYLLQGEALNFQLHEHSTYINAGIDPPPAIFNQYISMGLVNYAVDRDVLGNPRRIGGQVDVGAFETWRVEPNTAVEITALTNTILTEAEWRISSPEEKRNAFTNNYGGHKYPHRGSVVYMMDSSAMTMAYADEHDFEDFKHENSIILRPAYMLMKPGTSFYGNGHDVQLNYLAAEKRFNNQRFSMTAFPFDYNTSNITTTTYYPAQDSISILRSEINFDTYQYNGTARSAKDYNFQLNNSSLWQRVDTTNRTATYGYLMDFGQSRDTLLRFTAFGAELGQYVYTESEEEEDKIVYLTQYDHRTVGESGIDFTRQEDMGWNMKGLPWLVSSYRTDTILDESNFQRQMHIPHIFYQMDANADYLSTGNNVYTSRSWDRGSKMAMGNAFLTQTATQQAREAVYFHRPMYGRNEPLSRPIVRMTRRSANHKPAALTTNNEAVSQHSSLASDFLTLIPDSTANKTVEYRYGRDGVKWLVSNDKRQTADSQEPTASFYLLDSKRNSRISLLGAAPTEVDIPVGVNVAEEEDYTFSLPYRNAYADYKYVWFIDYDHNKYINLLDEDYTVTLPAGENTKRFAIRIDGFPKVDKDGKRQYVVYSYGGMLYVRGLIEGDKIDVYSPSGQHVYSTIATGPEFSMPLYDTSGFFIKVNDSSHKVLNISKR